MMNKDTAFAFDRFTANPDNHPDGDSRPLAQVCRFCGEDCEADDWNDATQQWTCVHCEDERNDARIEAWERGE